MTPEQTAMLAEEIEKTISAEEIEEVLPLTEGDGSIYRKDEETGVVNREKVVNGAEKAKVTFKMSMPTVQGPDFDKFMDAVVNLDKSSESAKKKAYKDSDIEKVNTGGIIGEMANEIIKHKHGQVD